MIERVVLVGLSGTGKSTLAMEAASRLGWSAFDMDARIEARSGMTIPAIFADHGEAFFRRIEREVFHEALAERNVVIATGGGAVIADDVWSEALLGDPATLTVHVDAAPDVILARLRAQAAVDGVKAQRPLLAEGDAASRLATQRETRASFYRRADVSLDVGARTVAGVATDVAELVNLANGTPSSVTLTSTSSPSRIDVGPGARRGIGAAIRETWPRARRIWLFVDANLRPLLGPRFLEEFGLGACDVRVLEVPAGESSKSVEGLSQIWDVMLDEGVDRSDVAIALGGGVVGDLIGFAAATVLRGIGFMQVPTTLLAMVDSSVGGKTAINHRSGKNLIGAFYQPARVIVDTELLTTLPEREFRSGWAEVIKHGIIEGSTPGGERGVLLDVLARNARALFDRESPLLPWVVRRNISLKASVVDADEKEANLRAILNFGHTIGHGIEASGYRMFHGEAIAVGMVAALRLAAAEDRIDAGKVAHLESLIRAYGLPTSAEVAPEDVRRHMEHDKKKAGGKQLWILPNREGLVTIERDVSDEHIDTAIASIVGP